MNNANKISMWIINKLRVKQLQTNNYPIKKLILQLFYKTVMTL